MNNLSQIRQPVGFLEKSPLITKEMLFRKPPVSTLLLTNSQLAAFLTLHTQMGLLGLHAPQNTKSNQRQTPS